MKSIKAFLLVVGLVCVAAVGNYVYNSFQPVYNVKDFGARADGVTDDSIVFNRILNMIASNSVGPHVMFIPEGRYAIRSTVFVPPNPRFDAPPITILGAGRGQTELLGLLTNVPCIQVKHDINTLGWRGLKFKDFSITGPLIADTWDASSARTTMGIYGGVVTGTQEGGRQWTFEGLRIAGFEYGLVLSNTWGTVITRCEFFTNRLAGMRLATAFYHHIHDCEIAGGLGRFCDSGIEILQGVGAGVNQSISDSYFFFLTNAVISADNSCVSYRNCCFERVGTGINGLNGSYNHLIGCDFSELFNQNIGDVGVTNGHPGFFQADGLTAQAFVFEDQTIENDGATPDRSFFWSYPTNVALFSRSGLNYWRPRYIGTLSEGVTHAWGAYGSTVKIPMFRDGASSPVFDSGPGPVAITNAVAAAGNSIGLKVQNGSTDRNVVIGADYGANTSTAGNIKGAGIGTYAYWANGGGAYQPLALLSYHSFAAADNGDVAIGGTLEGNGLLGSKSVSFVTSTNGGAGTTGTPRWQVDALGNLVNLGNADAGALVDRHFAVKTTDYSCSGQESIVMQIGNKLVNLPGASTNVGKHLFVLCYGASGTNAIVCVGSATIIGTAANKWTNTAPGRSWHGWCDGTNWWTIGGNL